jgi:hypothetical protein
MSEANPPHKRVVAALVAATSSLALAGAIQVSDGGHGFGQGSHVNGGYAVGWLSQRESLTEPESTAPVPVKTPAGIYFSRRARPTRVLGDRL